MRCRVYIVDGCGLLVFQSLCMMKLMQAMFFYSFPGLVFCCFGHLCVNARVSICATFEYLLRASLLDF